MVLHFKFIFICMLLQATLAAAGDIADKAAATLRKQVMEEASWALQQLPVTVTAVSSPRSAGGIHDFYSEGDYWWPDSANPGGPYIQRDGMTNPQNFVAHRQAMIRFSRIEGSLASAYKLTGEKKYLDHAMTHLKAWFADPATLMNPNLLYAQAISGRFTGRGIGIIDTIHLIEVAQALMVFRKDETIDQKAVAVIERWFSDYLAWLTSHKYGQDEMNAKNNHGTCWVMQVAVFAKLTGDKKLQDFCRDRYKEVLLPNQMSENGSFSLELQRTKPYGYSIFNLDAMTMICQVLSDADNDLWKYQTPDGRSIRKGMEFLSPYIADKSKWPYKQDIMYWNDWPVAQPFLLFGAIRYNSTNLYRAWKKLNHQPLPEEVIRNLPVRNPLIWLN